LSADGDLAAKLDVLGETLAVARAEGRTAKATDLLIIATAVAHGRRLHTRDERQAGLARAAGITVDFVAA